MRDLPLVQLLQAKLKYGSARQAVLAQNVANADTPDYRARDVQAPDFKQIAINSSSKGQRARAMTLTDSQHIAGFKPSNAYDSIKRPTTNELNPNGNNVVIEEEMMNVAFNQAEYQRSLSMYKKMMDMMRIAIGRPGQ